MPSDCGAGGESWESLRQQGNQPWIFIGKTDAKAPILWPPDAESQIIRKDPYVGKDWRGEGDSRGWDEEITSTTQWTWIWANFGTQWRTKEPDVLQSIWSQSWMWLNDWTTTRESGILSWGRVLSYSICGTFIIAEHWWCGSSSLRYSWLIMRPCLISITLIHGIAFLVSFQASHNIELCRVWYVHTSKPFNSLLLCIPGHSGIPTSLSRWTIAFSCF